MSEQGGQIHKTGIAIGVISMYEIPTRWAEHQERWRGTIPSALFWKYIYVIGKYYDKARIEVVERARKQGAKWLLFVDSDVLVPFDGLQRLLSHQKEIVTGVYWMKTYPAQPVVFEVMGNGPMWDIGERTELTPVGGAGLGCCLIDIKVFDAFDRAGIPYFKCDWDYTVGSKTYKVPVGEDHYFFIKAKELGFQPYCDPNVLCDHYDPKADVLYPGEEEVRRVSGKKLEKLGYSNMNSHTKNLMNNDSGKPTIVFFNSHATKFTGDTLKRKPLGGTESDLIRMAYEVKKKGCNVIVYCNCEKEGVFDGVLYLDYAKFDPKKKIDVFISSRDVDIFNGTTINSDVKVLWTHDMPNSGIYKNIDEAIGKINYVLAISEFQAVALHQCYPFIPKEKIIVTRNGVTLERYNAKVEREKYKCIYSSTPFRGLDVLLDCWPEIVVKVPKAELYVFSSMKLYGMEDGKDMVKLIEKAKSMRDIGVHYSPPIPQDELARHQKSARLLAYPNHFPETFCVTAAECISAYTPIVTSDYGALTETVGDCGIRIPVKGKFIPDYVRSKEYKEQFIEAVVKLLTDEEEWNKYHENCKKVDYSWKGLAEQWLKAFLPPKNINTKDYWNKQYEYETSKKVNEFRDDKEGWEEAFKEIKETDDILDYGCGLAHFFEYLKNKEHKGHLVGVDISDFALSKAKEKVPEGAYFNHIDKLQDLRFDVITCFHTLEHFDKPITELKKMKKYLKKEGKIIFSLPINDEPWPEHPYIWTKESVKEMMTVFYCTYKMQHRYKDRRHKDGRRFEEVQVVVRFEDDEDYDWILDHIPDCSHILHIGKGDIQLEKMVKARRPHATLHNGNEIAENSFDACILKNILEKQSKPLDLLKQIGLALKPTGSLYLVCDLKTNKVEEIEDWLRETDCISMLEIEKAKKLKGVIKFKHRR